MDLTRYLNTEPTLDAMRDATEEAQNRNSRGPRGYLGMSALGKECTCELWLSYRWAMFPQFDAATLWRFEDGHRTEDLVADRLRLVPGLTLVTEDQQSGGQIGFSVADGNVRGHCDGMLLGLKEAPKSWHVWENKSVNEKKFSKLKKLKLEAGEKEAIRAWDGVYWAQVQLYMLCAGVDRSYHTVTTPGGRDITSCRTNLDRDAAQRLIDRGARIVEAKRLPPKISENPAAPACRWCDFAEFCHLGKRDDVETHCRTCRHGRPDHDGLWWCGRHDTPLDREAQLHGCGDHEIHDDLS